MLFTLTNLSPCFSQQAGRAKELQEAVTLLRNRQYPAAIEKYDQILEADPHNERATLGLAAAYFGIYNYDETRRLLNLAAADHPKSGAPLLELGKLEIHLLHYDDAIAELKRSLTKQPNSAAAHEQMGVAYQAKGDDDNALTQFNEAIRLAAAAGSAYYFRGNLYADRNDDAHAYQDAAVAYRLEPNPQSRGFLAKTAVRLNKCDESIALLQPLEESKEISTEDLYLLSRAYKCAGQTQRAQELRDDYEKRTQAEQDAKTHKMKADHLAANAGEFAQKNELNPALDLLKQALAEDAENGPSLALLAKIDYSRGDIPKAQEEIHQALSGDPYNPDYLYVLGKVLEPTEKAAALRAFQQVVLVNPHESDAYYEMGELYLQMGQRGRAAAALRKAIQLSPGDPDYKKALGELDARKKDR